MAKSFQAGFKAEKHTQLQSNVDYHHLIPVFEGFNHLNCPSTQPHKHQIEHHHTTQPVVALPLQLLSHQSVCHHIYKCCDPYGAILEQKMWANKRFENHGQRPK
ncbi:hypothetical protein Ahia01_000092500 [Argonauta hians]